MLKSIIIALVAIVAVLLLFAARRPDSFRVERSTLINASPDRVFGFVDDFHQWAAWSPWEKLDPGMKRTHGGAASGKTATYAWEGNNKVGQGRMEIIDTAAPGRIVIKLDFLKPFEAHNTAEFTFQPEGAQTRVNWVMHGPANFMTKLMGVFMSMDKMVGKDFEAGLANLKAAAEK